MIIPFIKAIWKVLFLFRDYEPQKVTLLNTIKWVNQFPLRLRLRIVSLLDKVIYISKETTRTILIDLNSRLIERLKSEGINIDSVIYISMDEAGSSSDAILGMLRDSVNLGRAGAKLINSRDVRKLIKVSSELNEGAIIYIDDFSGSGRQFRRNHKDVSNWIIGSFPEFLLVPVICQEAYELADGLGVEPVSSMVHSQLERPLHPLSDELPDQIKSDFYEIFQEKIGNRGLGFRELATMVVFYRNSPNSTPLIFRGTIGQEIFRGIFPRHDDLPIRNL